MKTPAAPEVLKILVIEDNLTDLRLMRSLLLEAGHEVGCAGSAEEALQVLALEKPRVILLDLGLPRMDGLALVQQLHETPETSGIPVIVVTAFAEHFTKHAARRAGAVGYLTKPIDTRALTRQVEAAARHG